MKIEISRTLHSQRLNEIISDPSVFDMIAPFGVEKLDTTETLNDPNNIALMSDDQTGGFIFNRLGTNEYEVHTQFLPDGRGSYAAECARAAFNWMFTKTEALEIRTRVPAFNLPALALAKACGFVQEFTRKDAWVKRSGLPCNVHFLTLTAIRWMTFESSNVERGEWFHKELTAAGVPVDHGDDQCHDRAVGACLGILFNGLIDKSVYLYNRWALTSGYSPIGLISRFPCVLDIGSGIIEIDIERRRLRVLKTKIEPTVITSNPSISVEQLLTKVA